MANTVAIQTLVDGVKNAVLKVYLASDGAAGELTDQVVVDVSALVGAPTQVTLISAEIATTGCALNLEWDATTDIGILNFPADFCEKLCFEKFGGIPNNAGTGKTGDIVLTTTGFTAAGDQATLLLHVRKD